MIHWCRYKLPVFIAAQLSRWQEHGISFSDVAQNLSTAAGKTLSSGNGIALKSWVKATFKRVPFIANNLGFFDATSLFFFHAGELLISRSHAPRLFWYRDKYGFAVFDLSLVFISLKDTFFTFDWLVKLPLLWLTRWLLNPSLTVAFRLWSLCSWWLKSLLL